MHRNRGQRAAAPTRDRHCCIVQGNGRSDLFFQFYFEDKVKQLHNCLGKGKKKIQTRKQLCKYYKAITLLALLCAIVYLAHAMRDGKIKCESSPGSATTSVSFPTQSQSPVSGSLSQLVSSLESNLLQHADSESFPCLVHTPSVNCTLSHSVPFSFLHLFSSSQFSPLCKLPVSSHMLEYAYYD